MDKNDKKNDNNFKTIKNAAVFTCVLCDFKCSKRSNYEEHLLTRKHKRQENLKKNALPETSFFCPCGKKYKFLSGLSRHKNICNYWNLVNGNNKCQIDANNVTINDINNVCINSKNISNNIIEDISKNRDDISKDLIVKVLQENSDIKEILIKQYETMQNQQRALEDQHKQLKELIPKVGNNNTVTNLKQKFNINIFLNEQCKDAINMDDFIKQINISLENLDTTKQKGLTEGLSNLLIENINKLSVYERPVHCTDTKRETLYIKDNDVWEKDGDKSRIKTALRDLSQIQSKNIKQWIDANPDYMDNQEKQEYFIDLVRRCTGDLHDIDNKVIKKVCNTVSIKETITDE